jgi:TP901 family phage tail tape measure protein
MDGLNLGLAINIADGASVNANKINSALEKLINLAENLTKNSKTTGSAVDKMGRDFLTTEHNANRTTNAVHNFGNTLEHHRQHLVDFRAGVVRLFPYITVLGGIYMIKRGISEILETTKNVEYAAKNVQAGTGYTNEEMSMIVHQFNEMSTHGVVSMQKIVDAAYDLTTTLPMSADKVKGFTQSVINYSQATQSEVRENGVSILRLVAQYGRPISETTQMFDQMAMALNRTSIRANRITEDLKLVGTEASTMKVPFNELLSILGRTDLYYGAEGATRLRMLFQMLSQNLPYHTKMLQQYGLTFSDLDIKTHGFFNVMKKLQGIPYGDMSRLVGGYSAGLLVRLSSAKDLAQMLSDAANFTPEKTQGKVSTMNLINLNSLPGQISNMQNRWDSFKRSLGATLEGPFMGSLKGIGAFITRLDESFARSRAGWEATWKFFGGIVGGITGAVGKMFDAVLRFAGLTSDSEEEARSNMQNHLIPFLVFIEEVKIRAGAFFGGFMEGAGDAFNVALTAAKPFMKLIGWFFDILPSGTDNLRGIGQVLGFLAGLWISLKVATEAATAAQWLFNLAADANPIILIISAVIALIYTLATNWDDIVHAFKRGLSSVLGVIDLIVNNLAALFSPSQWMSYLVTGKWNPTQISNLQSITGKDFDRVGKWEGGNTVAHSDNVTTSGGKTYSVSKEVGSGESLRTYANMLASHAKRDGDGKYHFAGGITIISQNGDPKEIASKIVDEITKQLAEKEKH